MPSTPVVRLKASLCIRFFQNSVTVSPTNTWHCAPQQMVHRWEVKSTNNHMTEKNELLFFFFFFSNFLDIKKRRVDIGHETSRMKNLCHSGSSVISTNSRKLHFSWTDCSAAQSVGGQTVYFGTGVCVPGYELQHLLRLLVPVWRLVWVYSCRSKHLSLSAQ